MPQDNNDQYEKLAKKLHDKCKKCKKSFPISDLHYGPNSYGHGSHDDDDDCATCDSCNKEDSSDSDNNDSDSGGDGGGGDSSGGDA